MSAIDRLRAGYFAPMLRFGFHEGGEDQRLTELRRLAIELANEIEQGVKVYPVRTGVLYSCSKCKTTWPTFSPKYCHECGGRIDWNGPETFSRENGWLDESVGRSGERRTTFRETV